MGQRRLQVGHRFLKAGSADACITAEPPDTKRPSTMAESRFGNQIAMSTRVDQVRVQTWVRVPDSSRFGTPSNFTESEHAVPRIHEAGLQVGRSEIGVMVEMQALLSEDDTEVESSCAGCRIPSRPSLWRSPQTSWKALSGTSWNSEP